MSSVASALRIDAVAEIPFRAVLEPLGGGWRVQLASDLERALGQGSAGLVAPSVLDDAWEGLLERLAYVCARPLYAQFSALRFLRYPFGTNALGSDSRADRDPASGPDPTATALYEEFVRAHIGPGWERLMSEFPELRRMVTVVGDRWVASVEEILGHLGADLPRLEDAVACETGFGPLTGLRLNRSDPHRRGRMVAEVRFASGRRWVYKPKSVGAEQTLGQILREVSAGALQPDAALPVIVDGGDHGWVEYLEHEPLEDLVAAERFWQRAGVLLAVCHALGSTDLHFENLLAHGEYPMVLDAETALSARVAGEEDDVEPARIAGEVLQGSVAAIGLLPMWAMVHRQGRRGDAPEGVQLGGLGETGHSQVLQDVWDRVNTDAMTLRQSTVPTTSHPNLPELSGRPIPGNAYVDQLVVAFCAAYGYLLANRASIGAPGGAIDALARYPVRVVYRPTDSYFRALLASKDLACLRDSAARRRLLVERLDRRLNTPVPQSGLGGGHKAMAAEELAALLDLDIPEFTVAADDVRVLGDRGPPLCESPRARALGRLAQLSPRDRDYQVDLIRAAFSAPWPARRLGQRVRGARAPAVERVRGRMGATSLARVVADAAIEQSGAGHATAPSAWLGAVYDHILGGVGVWPLGVDLYAGTPGMAMALADMARIDGQDRERWGRLARACAEPLLRETGDWGGAQAPIGLGLGAGLGGRLFCLARTADALGEEAYLDAARSAGEVRVIEAAIDADQSHDLLEGSAGLVLGLLAVNSRAPEDRWLSLAERAGRHLLASRVPAPSGHRSWPSFGGAFLCGAAHGAAGIALALARLAAAMGELAFAEAAMEALAYERSRFDPVAGRWPDLRPSVRPDSADRPATGGWCHGSPGAAICRAGVLQAFQSGAGGVPRAWQAAVRADLDRALESILRGNPPTTDSLCCGESGRIQALLITGTVLRRPGLIAEGKCSASALAARATGGDDLRLVAQGVPLRLAPSLMQGACGVAHTLLATTYPEEVRPLLGWSS